MGTVPEGLPGLPEGSARSPVFSIALLPRASGLSYIQPSRKWKVLNGNETNEEMHTAGPSPHLQFSGSSRFSPCTCFNLHCHGSASFSFVSFHILHHSRPFISQSSHCYVQLMYSINHITASKRHTLLSQTFSLRVQECGYLFAEWLRLLTSFGCCCCNFHVPFGFGAFVGMCERERERERNLVVWDVVRTK